MRPLSSPRFAACLAACLVLLDVGPNLGALNRAALVASDVVVVPLAADLFSLRGLRNLGPTLREWREGWRSRRQRPHAAGIPLPSGAMKPIGYVVLQHAAKKANEPAQAYHRWIDRFPKAFHEELLGDVAPEGPDPYRLALLRHFRSLLPLSLEARKAGVRSEGSGWSHRQPRRDRRERLRGVRNAGARDRGAGWGGVGD